MTMVIMQVLCATPIVAATILKSKPLTLVLVLCKHQKGALSRLVCAMRQALARQDSRREPLGQGGVACDVMCT